MLSFGEKLKRIRVEVKKLSLAEAANQLSVPKSNLNNWERGIATPSLETICKLAVFYNCTVDYLVGYERKGQLAETIAMLENLPDDMQDHVAAIIRDLNDLVKMKKKG